MDQSLINRIVEAALLAATQPLTLAQLYALFPEDQPIPNDAVEIAIQQLQEDSERRGVQLVEVASGFRYQVTTDVYPWVARLWTERQTKYTRATLETLALIAYRQPITRGEIEQVRGVAVSTTIIKSLEEREWIRVVGHRDVPGKPALYGTTKAFLDYFGLKRLDELPPLSELKDIGSLEPELPLEAMMPASAAMPANRVETETTLQTDSIATVFPIETDAQNAHNRLGETNSDKDTASDTSSTEDELETAVPVLAHNDSQETNDTQAEHEAKGRSHIHD